MVSGLLGPLVLFAVGMTVKTLIDRNLMRKEYYRRVLIAPPKDIEHFAFGFNENIADSLWIRVIQDNHYCEQRPVKGEPGYESNAIRPIDCKKGWVYFMLDTIIDLAPRFRMPHLTGGLMLSVLVGDREGASQLFDKSLSIIQDDWALYYRAAYHFQMEEKDYLKAASLFEKVAPLGGPWWTTILASRLRAQHGDPVTALELMEGFVAINPDYEKNPKIQSRLKELRLEVARSKQKLTPSKPKSQ